MKQKIIMIIFIILLLFAGCSYTGQVIQDETIKIGYIGPLTGDAASIGAPGVAGAELAIKEVNDAGGLFGKRIELIIEDDGCSTKSVDAIKKLILVDKVIAITGPDCGSAAGPALPIAQDAGIPVVIRWASAPSFTEVGDYIFRVYPSDALQGKFAAEYIFNTLNKKRVAVMYVQNDYGVGLRDVFVDEFQKLGGKIVYDQAHSDDLRDFRTELEKIKLEKPEVIFTPTYRGVGRVLLKQIKESSMDVMIIGGDAFDADEIIKSDEAEGVLFGTPKTSNPEEFKARVRAETGLEDIKVTAPLGYDSVMAIVKAIEMAESTKGVDIKNALVDTSFEGVSYDNIEFDEVGNLLSDVVEYEMRIVRDKKSVIFTD